MVSVLDYFVSTFFCLFDIAFVMESTLHVYFKPNYLLVIHRALLVNISRHVIPLRIASRPNSKNIAHDQQNLRHIVHKLMMKPTVSNRSVDELHY